MPPSASITTILPSEIIDHTIDILAIDDRLSNSFHLPNIKACSLTCRTLLPRSRHHIFSRIKIHEAERFIPRYPPETPPCALASSFSKLLTRSPHLAAYIRELYYVFPELGGCLPDVPPILKNLTGLKTLALYSDNGGTLEWSGINPRSRSVFLHLMHLPSITSLKFGSILYFPPSVLFPCVNLQKVYFDEVSFDECDVACLVKKAIASSKPIKLQELEMLRMDRSVHETVSKILNKTTRDGKTIFDLSSLKTATVDIQYQDHIQLTSEILTQTQNIRNIHLLVKPPHNYSHHDKATTDQIIPLLSESASLETLQSLTLTLNFTNTTTPKTSLLRFGDIPRALKAIGSEPSNKIRHLRIHLNIPQTQNQNHNQNQNQSNENENNHIVGAKDDTANNAEWESLAEGFVTPGCWSCLKSVDIGVYIEGGDCGNPELVELVGARTRLVEISRALESRRLDVVFDFVAADASKVSRNSGIERGIV